MPFPPDFTLRPLTEADLEGWLALLNAVEVEQRGAPQTSAAHLRAALDRADPRVSRLIAYAGGAPAAYGLRFAQIPERSAVYVVTHPRLRRRGIGSAVLERLCAAAREAGAAWAAADIDETDSPARAFAIQNGFEPFSHAWVLRAPAEAAFSAPEWPAGFSARSYAEVNDLGAFTRAINRGYGAQWGHDENTAGGVSQSDAARYLANFDPRAVFLLFDPSGEPVGSARVEPAAFTGAEEDVLDAPGVDPAYAALPLKPLLALHALAFLRSLGRRPVRLESWGDSPETAAQYQALGFALAGHDVSYRQGLRPPIQPPQPA